MNYNFSAHAILEMSRRGIDRFAVKRVLENPEQKIPQERGDIVCLQSRVEMDGKHYLLRVMVNETVAPRLVVTVYRTGKIEKYWR